MVGPVIDLEAFSASQKRVRSGSRSLPAERVPIEDASCASGKIEEALRQAHKMAAVGEMATGLAHDFNNVLQSVASALRVMQRKIESGKTEELNHPLELAGLSVDRAADLIHRLLAFSRPHPVAPRTVSVNAIVASMQDLLRYTLGPQIALDLVLMEGLAHTRCDLHQFENVLLNLAVNAKDAMPDGGMFTIETFAATYGHRVPGTPPERYVVIEVSDTGTGMAPEVAARAFDPFFTTKADGRGTGLGLAMTRRFAEQYRGRANIESVVGAGTSISLHLPCAGGSGKV
jgi:signal transduction histidine kinase